MDEHEQTQLILGRVTKWAGSRENAQKWFDQEFIPALGSTTKHAVEHGYYEAVNDYLDAIELGGFA
ncbi:hypothetical protein [Flavobacterium sp. W21_SRS_FM6]|uniref:hypothetical protein n=1 Tax=Flavobacterium sp. W21_SRS_FM6 TaxID=3240268 RepID=UPI003F903C6A